MPADRTSVSTDKLCTLCEVATGPMIWRDGLRGNASTEIWWCSHDDQLPGYSYRGPRCKPTLRPSSQLRVAQLPIHAMPKLRGFRGEDASAKLDERSIPMRPAETEGDAAPGLLRCFRGDATSLTHNVI